MRHTHTHTLATEIIRKNAENEREEVEERRIEKIEIKNGDMTGARFAHVENEGKLRRQETEQTEGQKDTAKDRQTDRGTDSYREAKAEVEDSR